MARFTKCDETHKEYYKEVASAKNTKTSTFTWLNVFNTQAADRGNAGKHIYTCQSGEPNYISKEFYVEICEANGEEYEPQCLNVIITWFYHTCF